MAEAGPAPSRAQAACLAAGLVAVAAVLATPFRGLAHARLWAHMVQHVVLVAVAAPLLVLADPVAALRWTLPGGARRRWAPPAGWLRHGPARHYAAWAGLALVLHTATLWAWHLPRPYEAALRSEPLHLLEHATLFVTASVFWWVVVGTRRRALYGPGVLVTFAAALQGSGLGALMALATSPWYPTHARVGAASGLTALEDQQVAGVIMWGPCGAIYALAAVLLFAAWIRRPDGGGWAPVENGRGPEPV